MDGWTGYWIGSVEVSSLSIVYMGIFCRFRFRFLLCQLFPIFYFFSFHRRWFFALGILFFFLHTYIPSLSLSICYRPVSILQRHGREVCFAVTWGKYQV